MRVVVQRVSRGEVRVDKKVVGRIDRGLVLLVGIGFRDSEDVLPWMAEKLCGLRIFPDREGRMNLSLDEVDGALLVISQFTLYGDAGKGRRPSFVDAAPPGKAEKLFDAFVDQLRQRVRRVETGIFGATMSVELCNEGPVTLIVER